MPHFPDGYYRQTNAAKALQHETDWSKCYIRQNTTTEIT
jgi:hypothetical protein